MLLPAAWWLCFASLFVAVADAGQYLTMDETVLLRSSQSSPCSFALPGDGVTVEFWSQCTLANCPNFMVVMLLGTVGLLRSATWMRDVANACTANYLNETESVGWQHIAVVWEDDLDLRLYINGGPLLAAARLAATAHFL
jgi:hypothetical protein